MEPRIQPPTKQGVQKHPEWCPILLRVEAPYRLRAELSQKAAQVKSPPAEQFLREEEAQAKCEHVRPCGPSAAWTRWLKAEQTRQCAILYGPKQLQDS
jgi:hypothetical protein